jgi:hypothetical protein
MSSQEAGDDSLRQQIVAERGGEVEKAKLRGSFADDSSIRWSINH